MGNRNRTENTRAHLVLTASPLDRIRHRLRAQQGFTLIELLVVVQVIGIVTMVAVPTYLNYKTRALQATAQANVRSAQTGADMWYADKTGGNGAYTGLMRSKLVLETPGVSPTIMAGSVNGGAGYCIEETKGAYTYDYIGGVATPLGAWKLATIQAASCLTAAGTAALAT
jgi:prepilin-type N-terminal cleavage/methylation domain-containing protein